MTDVVESPPIAPQAPPSLSRWQRILLIFTFCVFGIAQPIFSLVPDRTVFIHDLQPRWAETILFALSLTVALPAACCLCDRLWIRFVIWVAQRLPKYQRWIQRTQDLVLLGLVFIVLNTLFKPLCDVRPLHRLGIAWLVLTLTTMVLSVPMTIGLNRLEWLRRWVLVCSIGAVLFPAHFLWRMSANIHATLKEASKEAKPVANPVPVVMIVFDEFCGITLQNENREIDAGRFPNFARLSRMSNWYRNATTNAGATIDALPTLLSGKIPDQARRPILADYPQNLFQMIRDSEQYEMVVFEPVSRLCDETINDHRRIPRSTWEQLETLSLTSASVYPHLVMAKDSPLRTPAIPKIWFGLGHPSAADRERRQGLIQYYWDADRDVQLNHYLDCVTNRESSEFYFLHVVLPHFPWQLYPSGNYYVSEINAHITPVGAEDEVWAHNDLLCAKAWERYVLQVSAMDLWLGQLLDRLEQEGLLDECLLVVTADHGVSFTPGHPRRRPEGRNLAEILSIPLFIKRPHQSTSEVIDQNAESIDVFPTIASVLQQPLKQPVDGQSLFEESLPQRPRKTILFEKESTVAEANFPQAAKLLQRQLKVIGSSTSKDKLFRVGPRPEILGRPVSEFTVKEGSRVAHVIDALPSRLVEKAKFVPGLIDGQIANFDEQSRPLILVCAVEGVIQSTTLTFAGINCPGRFYFVLPESARKTADIPYELYAFSGGKSPTLERIEQKHYRPGQYTFKEVRSAPPPSQRAGTPKTVSKP